MEKRIVFSCPCFIDQSVWFVNSSVLSQKFDVLLCENGLLSGKNFIYQKNFTFVSEIYYINEIIVCCLECFEFMLSYLSFNELSDVLNDIQCSYVSYDCCLFDSDIFLGNNQFMVSNASLTHQQREELYFERQEKMKKIFKGKIETKSCFTYLEKYKYEFLCNKCKEIFIFYFLDKLFRIERK